MIKKPVPEGNHVWGWSFLPARAHNNNASRDELVGIAHCFNANCGLTITKVVRYNWAGTEVMTKFPVPEEGCPA